MGQSRRKEKESTQKAVIEISYEEEEVMKVFDAETLQQEVEARRSRSNQSIDLSTKSEKVPPLSDYSTYPPLDQEALRSGYTLCIENAQRLLTDAKVLARSRTLPQCSPYPAPGPGGTWHCLTAVRSGPSDYRGLGDVVASLP